MTKECQASHVFFMRSMMLCLGSYIVGEAGVLAVVLCTENMKAPHY